MYSIYMFFYYVHYVVYIYIFYFIWSVWEVSRCLWGYSGNFLSLKSDSGNPLIFILWMIFPNVCFHLHLIVYGMDPNGLWFLVGLIPLYICTIRLCSSAMIKHLLMVWNASVVLVLYPCDLWIDSLDFIDSAQLRCCIREWPSCIFLITNLICFNLHMSEKYSCCKNVTKPHSRYLIT